MKHSSIRELFNYWNERRGRRAAPERGDIEPGEIRGLLADTFILAFDAPTSHPFRIAGTRVCALFGRELKGEPFVDLWAAASQPLVHDLLTVVASEATGAVAGVRAANLEGSSFEFELLALPLYHRGRTNARLLGALVPTNVPAWLGTSALGPLTLGTLRYLGPGIAVDAGPPVPAFMNGRPHRGLVVYDGGRT
jgi:hypothetical protein